MTTHFLFEKKKPVSNELVKMEVSEINKKRLSSNMQPFKRIKIKCRRRENRCKIYGLLE